jgi:hypothetical protein
MIIASKRHENPSSIQTGSEHVRDRSGEACEFLDQRRMGNQRSLVYAAASNSDQNDWFLQPMIFYKADEPLISALEDLTRRVRDIGDHLEMMLTKKE